MLQIFLARSMQIASTDALNHFSVHNQFSVHLANLFDFKSTNQKQEKDLYRPYLISDKVKIMIKNTIKMISAKSDFVELDGLLKCF